MTSVLTTTFYKIVGVNENENYIYIYQIRLEKQRKLEHSSKVMVDYGADINIEKELYSNNGNRYIFIHEKILVMTPILTHLKKLY
ncbi:hypothetical protein BJ944DRAFT_259119 [Cunninghamella echinulata]|nr:hypothetical protein BJ944DRAFT_259119 [Cunninghamella echinulata]